MEQFESNEKDTVKEVMSAKLELIAKYLKQGLNKYAKIETKALKAYLDCQLSIAKKEARGSQPKSWLDEIGSN